MSVQEHRSREVYQPRREEIRRVLDMIFSGFEKTVVETEEPIAVVSVKKLGDYRRLEKAVEALALLLR